MTGNQKEMTDPHEDYDQQLRIAIDREIKSNISGAPNTNKP